MTKAARILVVDDEIDSVDLLVMMLTAQGFEAVGTTQPLVALDKFEAEDFDLVISDLLMPEIDGWMLLKRLAAIKPDVPVLALTARAVTGDKEKVLEAGFIAYLSKPVLMDQLKVTVTRILADLQQDAPDE